MNHELTRQNIKTALEMGLINHEKASQMLRDDIRKEYTEKK